METISAFLPIQQRKVATARFRGQSTTAYKARGALHNVSKRGAAQVF